MFSDLKEIKRRHIVFGNFKGGTGKTTTNAVVYNMLKDEVDTPDIIITFDPYSNLPELLNDESKDLYLAIKPSHEERLEWISELSTSENSYMIDLPGYHLEGQEVIFKSARKIVIPMKISDLDIQPTIDFLSYLENLGFPFEDIMIVVNDFQIHEKKIAENAYNEIRQIFDYDFHHIYVRHFTLLTTLTTFNRKQSKEENKMLYEKNMKDFNKIINEDSRYNKGIYPLSESYKSLYNFCKFNTNDTPLFKSK